MHGGFRLREHGENPTSIAPSSGRLAASFPPKGGEGSLRLVTDLLRRSPSYLGYAESLDHGVFDASVWL